MSKYFRKDVVSPVPDITITTNTWARESHGLYDYESKTSLKKVYDSGAEVNAQLNLPSAPSLEPTGSAELLARVVMRNNKFCVDAARVDNRVRSGKLWRVVKDLNTGYTLNEGDSIKLGRFKMKVRQICCLPVTDSDKDGNTGPAPALGQVASVGPLNTQPHPCDTSDEKLKELENVSCRICLLEGSSVEDPLIRPCECKGTIEYVHLGCLRHWVRGKLDIPEQQNGSYFYKPMSCELCKCQYATHMQDVKPGGTLFPLVELPKTTPPFIVLERDSNRADIKGVHVISLAERKFLKLGRGHESDVRFADVSISRWHATVHFDSTSQSFILSDHKSKFGTLVATKTPLPLEINGTVSLQVGRTVLEFKLNVSKSLQKAAEAAAAIEDGDTGTTSHNRLSNHYTHFGSGIKETINNQNQMNQNGSLNTNNTNLNNNINNNILLNPNKVPTTSLPPGTVLAMSPEGAWYMVSDTGEVVVVQPSNACKYNKNTGRLVASVGEINTGNGSGNGVTTVPGLPAPVKTPTILNAAANAAINNLGNLNQNENHLEDLNQIQNQNNSNGPGEINSQSNPNNNNINNLNFS